jgi:hypothetical protein
MYFGVEAIAAVSTDLKIGHSRFLPTASTASIDGDAASGKFG